MLDPAKLTYLEPSLVHPGISPGHSPLSAQVDWTCSATFKVYVRATRQETFRDVNAMSITPTVKEGRRSVFPFKLYGLE